MSGVKKNTDNAWSNLCSVLCQLIARMFWSGFQHSESIFHFLLLYHKATRVWHNLPEFSDSFHESKNDSHCFWFLGDHVFPMSSRITVQPNSVLQLGCTPSLCDTDFLNHEFLAPQVYFAGCYVTVPWRYVIVSLVACCCMLQSPHKQHHTAETCTVVGNTGNATTNGHLCT